MTNALALLSAFLASASALNIVAHGANNLKARTKLPAAPIVTPDTKLATIFKLHDSDNNGFLDAQELKAAFIALGHPATEETIKHSLSLLDKDHDGKISLAEFAAMESQNVMPTLAHISARDNGHAFEEIVD